MIVYKEEVQAYFDKHLPNKFIVLAVLYKTDEEIVWLKCTNCSWHQKVFWSRELKSYSCRHCIIPEYLPCISIDSLSEGKR